jgi:hypothetical protein
MSFRPCLHRIIVLAPAWTQVSDELLHCVQSDCQTSAWLAWRYRIAPQDQTGHRPRKPSGVSFPFRIQASTGDLHPKISEPKFLLLTVDLLEDWDRLRTAMVSLEPNGEAAQLASNLLTKRRINGAQLSGYQTRLPLASTFQTISLRPDRKPSLNQGVSLQTRTICPHASAGPKMRHP